MMESTSPADRPRGRWAPILLVVVITVVFSPVLFGGRTMYPTDITNKLFLPFSARALDHDVQETSITDAVEYYYPGRVFQSASFRRGRLPLWNPNVFGGHPALASDAGLTTFDPFNVALLLPNLGTALAWRSFLQVAACVILMFLFLRHLGLSAAAGVVGGLAFGLNSMFWVNIFDWSIAGLLWLPLVCLLVDRALQTPSPRAIGVAGLALGVALLASPLQVYAYIGLAVGGLFSLRWLLVERTQPMFARVLLVGVTVCALGVALSAIQLLPTLELLRHSARFAGGPLAATARHSRTLMQDVFATGGLVSFVFPNVAGRLKDSLMISGALWGGESYWQGFIGVAPFLLAAVGAAAGRDPRRLPYVVFGLLIVFVVVYTPIGTLLYDRAFVLYIFCASVLAAWGVHALSTGDLNVKRARATTRWLSLFVAAFVVALVALNVVMIVSGDRLSAAVHTRVSATLADNYLGRSYPALYLAKADQFLRDLRLWSPQTALPVLLAGASLICLHRRLQDRLSSRSFAAAAVVLTAVDLVFMTWTHVPLVDLAAAPFSPPSPVLDAIRRDHGRFRVLSYRASEDPPVLPLGTEAVYGLTAADGYDDLGPPNLSSIVTWTTTACGAETCATPAGVDLANVKYIVTGPHTRLPDDRFRRVVDGEVRVFQNQTALERAFWVTSYAVEADTDRAIARVRSTAFDPRVLAIVDREPAFDDRAGSGVARVSMFQDDADGVMIHVDAETAGLLIVSETYYSGWRAQIDGREAPVLRANGVMRAVAMEPGSHDVAFRYEPASLRIGAGMSLGALAVAVVALGFGARPKRAS